MRIIFTGGGTAGHINPALSVADFVRKKNPDAKILYVGAKGGMEEKLAKSAGFDFRGITVSGFSRSFSLSGIKKNIITLKNIFLSSIQSKKILNEFNPNICMGTGGYASGPLLKEATNRKIPIVIHEQNAFPGLTTKILSKKAQKVMLASAAAEKYFDKSCNIVITGNPVRCEIKKWTKEDARKKLGIDSKPVILSFGGSLGARRINEAVAELIAWSAKNGKYNHMHAYGKYGHWFDDMLKEKGVDSKKNNSLYIKEYIDDMPIRMAAADVIVCRAGAITLSEIEILGKTSILIPSPNVAENHQYHNAMELVKLNAAEMIEEKDLTGTVLIKKVRELIENRELANTYSNNLKGMAIADADERIYSIIKSII